MAQTLKFGNGTWATKKGSTLAYNDEDGNFKPLPFTYTGAGKGTRVNKEGLIEVVENDRPRIDYLDSEDGALLLEPQSSNDLQRSQEFDDNYWTKYQTSVLSNSSISPDGGLNADRLIEDNSNSTHQLGKAISYTIGTTYTVSIFAKSSDRNLEVSAGNTNTFPVKAVFDLKNGIVLSETFGSAAIQKFNNGWYRCVITASALATSTTNINFGLANGSTLSYNGNGVSFIELFGAMREQGSYATSYIPTQGASQTRVQETASGSGNSGVFNDSQGVLFANVKLNKDDGSGKVISLNDNTSSNNRMMLLFSNGVSNRISARFDSSGSDITLNADGYDLTLNHKVVLKYKANDIAIWVDGFEVNTGNSFSAPLLLNRIDFYNPFGGGQNNFYGKTKELAYYDTVLTDLELETLTSYRTWEEMVKELNLNIIHNE